MSKNTPSLNRFLSRKKSVLFKFNLSSLQVILNGCVIDKGASPRGKTYSPNPKYLRDFAITPTLIDDNERQAEIQKYFNELQSGVEVTD